MTANLESFVSCNKMLLLRWIPILLVAGSLLSTDVRGETVLGVGTEFLLGGDLTDPEDDGDPEADVNYNATFQSNNEPGFAGGEFSFNVFDNQVGGGNMKWCCGPAGGIPAEGLWVQAQLQAGPHFLTHFTVSSANDTPGRDPTDWEIQGSNDGINFDTIFQHAGSSLWTERNQVIQFDAGTDFPEQETAYDTFRMVTLNTELNPTGAYFQWSELELFGNLLEFVVGDFNSDDIVDLADFDIMRSNFQSGNLYEQGDINRDRQINLTDFVQFRTIFNAQGAAAVPEPSSALLLLLGLPLLLGRRIRRAVRSVSVVPFFFAVSVASLTAVPAVAQVSDVLWSVAGPADWATDANWMFGGNPNPVPDAQFFEGAVINNGGTAFVESAPPDILRLFVDNGRLEIRNGGSLNIITDTLEPLAGDGRTQAAGTISLQGNGTLDIGRDFTNAGVIDLPSADATFNIGGDFTQSASGSLQVAVNGANAMLNVGGTAQLGGTVIIDPASDPSFGDSFDIITASEITGGFTNVQFAPGVTPLGRGLVLAGVNANGTASVAVENRPVLVVDRATGKTDITNPVGAALTLTGYTISSQNTLLSPGGWQSLAGAGVSGWAEANPHEFAVSELNLTESTSIAVDETLSIGSAYNAANTLPADEDVRFEYSTPEGRILEGIVEYTGAVNDLVLNIDPTTGEAAISNLSTFTEDFDVSGYSIFSPSGSLLVDDWNGFEESGAAGEGWQQANPTATAINELNLTSSQVFANGTLIPIGKIVEPGSPRDLTFEFSIADTEIARFGTVTYGPFEAAPPGLAADFNKDGNVNLEDFNILKGNFGSSDATMADGDANMDGNVNLEDFNILKGQFGQSAAAVPEPSTGVLLAIAAGVLVFVRRRVAIR